MIKATHLSTITAAILALAAMTGTASAASVEKACASDYLAYCSKHSPTSPGVRTCMRANGNSLSQRCVNALVAAGEVSKAEVRSHGR